MFPYFGRKQRYAGRYGRPRYPLVIEPFAGSMGYTLYHKPRQAIGIERDERVQELWYRCLTLTPDAPPPALGQSSDDLLVKLCAFSDHSLTSKTMKVTPHMVTEWAKATRRITTEAVYARHIDYRLGNYYDAPDVEATWFIDPPYQLVKGNGYLHREVDYDELARWCRTRRGQVIVCEQAGAEWLPFRPLYDVRSIGNQRSREVVWCNEDDLPLLYDQVPLFEGNLAL